MSEANNKQGEAKKKRRFSQEQYEMLKRCSKKKDITEWNEWFAEVGENILLEGADLKGVHLERAQLLAAHLEGADLSGANLERAYLARARLQGASLIGGSFGHVNLCNANLTGAILKGAILTRSILKGANLRKADLESADLTRAILEDAKLIEANLDDTRINGANLKNVDLNYCHLKNAEVMYSNLKNVNLCRADLRGTNFEMGQVDGSTLIWSCKVDRDTNFSGVALENCRVDEGTKYLLDYNRRRMNSQNWYKGKSKQKWRRALRQVITSPVRLFLWMSDYGRSTFRILGIFFALALVFAAVYYLVPGLVHDLHGTGKWYSDMVRACYFSVVTMTTLGFGDMYAEKENIAGHILLMVQVLFGYVLLGALVTRFGVLFKSGLVICKFSKD